MDVLSNISQYMVHGVAGYAHLATFIHSFAIQFQALENTYSLLPACHSARRARPELQNPLSQKAKDNFLHWEKVPEGQMRDGEKRHFPKPHPPSPTAPPLPEDEGYSWDDGFCDFAFGSAQNDSIGGDIGELKKIKGGSVL